MNMNCRTLRRRLLVAAFSMPLLWQSACATDTPEEHAEEVRAAGSCSYEGVFTQLTECLEFRGPSWSPEAMLAECDAVGATLRPDESCTDTYALGQCLLPSQDDAAPEASGQKVVVIYSTDSADCDMQRVGCETFGGGTWLPEPLCTNPGAGLPATGVFVQPTLVCSDPVAGEEPGQGPDGQVCTWQAIAGCTEEGRRFGDYASCDVVRSQRPYYPAPPAEGWDVDDERLADPVYTAELEWVTKQMEASACVCCHATSDSPAAGPSNWYIDAPGNWVNTMAPSGMALAANWISSVAFGAFPPNENNGFNREEAGFPSTNPARMRAFFEAELQRLGYTKGDFEDAPAFGGPLQDQLDFKPSDCGSGDAPRVDSDGTVHWEGGSARYIYVLKDNSANPTVPPNLDLPEGTLWRLDVAESTQPLNTGELRYGSTPEGASQRFPENGKPEALKKGERYYLYVTRDVGVPITRCLFTF